ncbi:MAG: hypothetical protein P1U88_16375 [Thalassobaculaceae bacterium]|nr:hypothetical protein [Thalassobaculaceae bacterium]
MIRTASAAALRILLLLGVTGAAPSSTAAVIEKRVHLQVRNVTQGEELRLQVTNPGILNLLIADIRLSGVATQLADDEVTLDGGALVIRTTKPRINLNITLHALCETVCPAVLVGDVILPRAAYAMLRTQVQDVTLTTSGEWTLKLTGQ